MSGLAHYFEDKGLATVIISLVRKHTILIRPPRALWVPFELGRYIARFIPLEQIRGNLNSYE